MSYLFGKHECHSHIRENGLTIGFKGAVFVLLVSVNHVGVNLTKCPQCRAPW